MTHDQDILVLEQVGHRFGGFTVLRSVTFSVPEGGIVGLIGPNGSGKTTLFNIISGYLALQAGSITYGGRALTTQSVQDRSRAGMVRTFQTPKIFERMTVLENIMVGACKITRTGILQDLVRSPRAQSELRQIRMLAERVGEELGLEGNLPAATLTAGQRRILEIMPKALHQRTPLFLGSAEDVRECEQFIQEKHPAITAERRNNRHPGAAGAPAPGAARKSPAE